ANLGTTGLFSFTQSVDIMATPEIGGAALNIGLTATDGPSVFLPAEERAVLLSDSDMAMSEVTSGFGDFLGTGTFDVDFMTLSSSTVAGGGNLQALINTTATITATVEYTFDEGVPQIPLPASAPLLLAALGGLGFLSARRRKG
ncbi:MAG: choice-of-anchor E domain-containing protein, partial [Pseudomonadota bacterium]